MKQILLLRMTTSGKAVKGQMSVPFDQVPIRDNDALQTFDTLENADFLIPDGTYPIDLTWSPRFKKLLPEIQDVPEREGIRIHMGTLPEHSEGCVLTTPFGMTCIQAFINRIKKYFENEDITIKITSVHGACA